MSAHANQNRLQAYLKEVDDPAGADRASARDGAPAPARTLEGDGQARSVIAIRRLLAAHCRNPVRASAP